MSEVIVIGYGNPTRSDDGVGWQVASALPDADHVRVIVTQQLLPEHAAEIATAARVIFVDASVEGVPGTWRCMSLQPDDGQEESSVLITHYLTPAQLLTASRLLYGQMPEALLITVTGGDFGFGEGLSPPVQHALPDVIRTVTQQCGIYEREVIRGKSTKI